jgi:two-component system response regulator AtoC
MNRFLSDLFNEEGYEVTVAFDGPSALDRYREENFDIVLSDLMMPGMKGTDLVRRLMEVDPEALILVVTGFGSIENAVETMRAGAFGYLHGRWRSAGSGGS